jgi:hypothetical protein
MMTTTREKKNGHRGICQMFRAAVKRLCASCVWKKAEQHLDTISESALSESLAFERNQIYRFRAGDMSGECLYTILSEFGWPYAQLDPLPDLADRAHFGYQAAIHFLRSDGKEHLQLKDRESLGVALPILYAMILLQRDETYRLIRKERRMPTDAEWEMLADRISTEVAGAVKDGSHLRQLAEEWLDHVTECYSSIPYRWLTRGRKTNG